MSQIARFEKPYRVLDTAGNCMWTGHALCGTVYEVYTLTSSTYLPGNTAAGAAGTSTAGIAAGQAVIADIAASSTVVPRWNYASTDDPGLGVLYALPVASAASTGFLGVALSDIAARAATDPPGVGKGYVAGVGSITCVRVTTSTIAQGALVGGSATAGSCAALATRTSNLQVGVCVQTNTTSTTSPVGTGSTSQCGILVNVI